MTDKVFRQEAQWYDNEYSSLISMTVFENSITKTLLDEVNCSQKYLLSSRPTKNMSRYQETKSQKYSDRNDLNNFFQIVTYFLFRKHKPEVIVSPFRRLPYRFKKRMKFLIADNSWRNSLILILTTNEFDDERWQQFYVQRD